MKKSRTRRLNILIGFFASVLLNAEGIDESQYGIYQPGGYLIGAVEPGSEIYFKEKRLSYQSNGLYVIGFDREDSGIQEISFVDRVGGRRSQLLDIGSRQYNIQRINGIPASKVTPEKRDEERIYQEFEQVRFARGRQSSHSSWQQPFIWPLYGPITGVYGSQRVLNGIEKSPHFGVDVARPIGTPVYAPNSGQIVLADDLYFSGNTVIIDHGMGVLSTLMHMDDIVVSAGNSISQGDIVGHVGTTGRSTGPHLDWRINWNNIPIDPTFWVPPMTSICNPMVASSNNNKGKDEVVILFHGQDPDGSTMDVLSRSLLKDGYVICNQHYPSTQYSLEQQSGYLANAIAKAYQSGYSRIHVVTHGSGGLIARYYLQGKKLPGDGVVVMLSPPSTRNDVVDQLGRYRWFDKIRGPAAIQLSTDAKILSNRLKPIRSRVGIIMEAVSIEPWFSFLFKGKFDTDVFMILSNPPGKNSAKNQSPISDLERIRQFLKNSEFSY